MTDQTTSLAKLVDLALCNPEVGAVNFNHLRTLLLALVKTKDESNGLGNEELPNTTKLPEKVGGT